MFRELWLDEKSDHTLTRGQLQSTEIPEEKWQQVSIGFITDFPETSSGGRFHHDCN